MDVIAEALDMGLRWGRPDGVLVSRDAVVAEARTWIGTKFLHQGEQKGRGVDCFGLIRGTAVALGLLPADYRTRLPRQWHGYPRHPDGSLALQVCDAFLHRIEQDAMQAGDILFVRYDGDPQHTALLVPYRHGGLAVVHAAMRGVIETRLIFGTSPRSMKFVAAYQIPGVA